MTTASIRYWMDPNPNRLKYMMALRDLLRDMEQMVYKKTGIMPQRKDFDFDKYLHIINQVGYTNVYSSIILTIKLFRKRKGILRIKM